MKCDDASEFVSAINDGMTVPPAAAEHIHTCEHCRALLKEYIEMGAELRQLASLELAEIPAAPFQPSRRGFSSMLWNKSRKTMRIPRLAFALLMIAIVVLSSGWARQSVRAKTQGNVLFVQYTIGSNPARFCALSAVDKNNACAGVLKVKSGWLVWQIKVLSKDGDRANLGVRAKLETVAANANTGNLDQVPEEQYELTTGGPLKINAHDSNEMSISGQWIDHMPAITMGDVGSDHDIDPGPGELRFFSPLLISENKVLGDLEGASTTMTKSEFVVDLYFEKAGRFDISESPMPRAVEGKLQFNRISFTIDGKPYTFVTGVPISREAKIWVLHRPNPPAWDKNGSSYLSATEISKLFPITAQN